MPSQRDIVEVSYSGDYGGSHPAVIISNDLSYEMEGVYLCVMITSADRDDPFSYHVDSSMFMKPLTKESCQIRLQTISVVDDQDIVSNTHYNQMKIEPFRHMISELSNSIFSTNQL